MKRFAIPIMFIVVGVGLGFYLSVAYKPAKMAPTLTNAKIESDLGETAEFNTKMDSLIGAISDLKSHQKNLSDQFDKKITSLTQRISELESSEVSNQSPDTEYLDYKDDGNVELTEKGFAHWLDSSLTTEQHDSDKTNRITNETLNVLNKNLPGVNLDSISCAEGYCRASFSHINGEKPDTGKLFGEPPFMGQGFTIEEPDGRVLLYFTEAGQTLADLRLDANMAAEMGFIEP